MDLWFSMPNNNGIVWSNNEQKTKMYLNNRNCHICVVINACEDRNAKVGNSCML